MTAQAIASALRHPSKLLVCSSLPPKDKYALLIGINYQGQDWELTLPHHDVDNMKKFLISVSGYLPKNIMVMKDSTDMPPHLRPTEENLRREISSFIRPDQENVEYFFLYCGHSGQQDVIPGDVTEEDGKDEYIATLDRKRILDNDLHDWLVKPVLELKTTRLSAVLDTCHSETLLDLFHHRCNRVCGSSSLFRRSVRRAKEVIEPIFGPQAATPTFGALMQMGAVLTSPGVPVTVQCNGLGSDQYRCQYCLRSKDTARVVCISACKDQEETFEDVEGHSMTTDIIELLQGDRNQSLKQLIRAIDRRCHQQNKLMARYMCRSLAYQHPQVSTDVPARMSKTYFLASN